MTKGTKATDPIARAIEVLNRAADAAILERDVHDANANKAAADGWEKLRANLRASAAALAANHQDAERYRALRAMHWNDSPLFVVAGGRAAVKLGTDCPSGDRLDAAIDAVMRKRKP